MSAIFEILEKTAIASQAARKPCKGDYIKNGLLYCGTCKTPKQAALRVAGRELKPLCMCECEKSKFEAQKQEEKQRKEQERIKAMRKEAIHDAEIHKWTFENDNGCNPNSIQYAKRYVDAWEKMLRENIGVLFWGDTGVGKTYSAACIANYLVDNKISVHMTSFPRLINELSGFHIEDKNEYIDNLNKYKLLIIDDLGAERTSDYALEIVYNVIDGRYRANMPLIITTNLSLEEIKNPKDLKFKRIYDRILEMCVPLLFKGESVRPNIAKEKIQRAREMFE